MSLMLAWNLTVRSVRVASVEDSRPYSVAEAAVTCRNDAIPYIPPRKTTDGAGIRSNTQPWRWKRADMHVGRTAYYLSGIKIVLFGTVLDFRCRKGGGRLVATFLPVPFDSTKVLTALEPVTNSFTTFGSTGIVKAMARK